ncbi:hypothetical protein C8J57DRAFT_1732766 [Mycena rebaudengoi]|nr:hypothetical protein C8J57DRAFT_1732766 [Mycena rebaudengoi]
MPAAEMGRLPQELIDAIINQIAPQGEWAAVPDTYHAHESDQEALMACALTSRSFLPRSREHLFDAVVLDTKAPSKLEALVSESPHILTSYVKYVLCILDYDTSTRTADFTLASRILGLVPKFKN